MSRFEWRQLQCQRGRSIEISGAPGNPSRNRRSLVELEAPSVVHFSKHTAILRPWQPVPLGFRIRCILLLWGTNSPACGRMVQPDDRNCRYQGLWSHTRVSGRLDYWGALRARDHIPGLHSTSCHTRDLFRLRTRTPTRPYPVRPLRDHLPRRPKDKKSRESLSVGPHSK